MTVESDPKPSIVMLEDAVRQLGLRTGNLYLFIVNEKIAQTAKEIFFSKNPLEKYLEITKTEAFHQEVEKVKLEVCSRFFLNENLQEEHPLTVPNIQKLMLFRSRLLKQGRSYFEVHAGKETLKIPLDEGFIPLAARMIVNQLKNYNKSANDPNESFRQFGYTYQKKF